jgi:hypothetical protein
MLYIKVSLIAVFAVAAVHAARYCQCENRNAGRIFSGIQAVCSQLSNSWCSTNCNIWNENCDYCQYTPAGGFPDAVYAVLKTWCLKQFVYDRYRNQIYSGTEVSCYSFENKASCATCGGCKYSSTSFYKRLAIRQDDGEGSDPNPAPDAATILQQTLLGVKLGGFVCTPLFTLGSQIMAQEFAASYPECSIVNLNSDPVEIDCGILGDFTTAGQNFTALCNSFGGQSGAVGGNGNIIDPQYPDDPDN